ncbi:tetratricopeptide repeat protein [Microcoleus sp. HI-ES]|nr:tetratricopeptide repeat protein [Microcoleus sp. HI-ES]
MHSRSYHFSYLAAISIVLSPALSLLAISDALAYAPTINARRTQASDSLRDSFASLAQARDPKTQADELFETGVKQHREGLFREAIETFEQVLAIRKQLGDQAGIGETLNNMGEAYGEMGLRPEALEVLRQALVIHREISGGRRIARTLNLIGFVNRIGDNFSEAMKLHQDSL